MSPYMDWSVVSQQLMINFVPRDEYAEESFSV